MTTHFLSLSDIVLLEIFQYLSCEDVLCAFASSQNDHLNDLLGERGAFRQIRLSSQLSRAQHLILSKGIWRNDLVQSFICKDRFSDFLTDLTPCPIFPLLTELRILGLRCTTYCTCDFVIAHSSTLKRLIITRNDQPFILNGYQTLLHTVLPHLCQLTLLDTDQRSKVSVRCIEADQQNYNSIYLQVNWKEFEGCLQSLEFLCTFVESMSDVYLLAMNDFFPRLRSLRIHVNKPVFRTITTESSMLTRLHMSKLETFDLRLRRNGEVLQEEEGVQWAVVERLISSSVMPRLRRFSILYDLSTSTEIEQIFQSSLFNDQRHIRVRFALFLRTWNVAEETEITNIFNIRSSRYSELLARNVSIFFTLHETSTIDFKGSLSTFIYVLA